MIHRRGNSQNDTGFEEFDGFAGHLIDRGGHYVAYTIADDGLSFLVLERTSVYPPYAEYIVVSSRKSTDLTAAIENAAEEGYDPVKLFVEPGVTALLMEKLP